MSGNKKFPKFDVMSQQYPKGSYKDVKKNIGGKVNYGWITNTCAIRISRVLNYAGQPIPFGWRKNWAVSGSDGKWYAYRHKDMHDYITQHYGPPTVKAKSKYGDGNIPSGMKNKKGIISFFIKWKDATGHIDLWDGSQCADRPQCTQPVGADQSYFWKATEIYFWEAPTGN